MNPPPRPPFPAYGRSFTGRSLAAPGPGGPVPGYASYGQASATNAEGTTTVHGPSSSSSFGTAPVYGHGHAAPGLVHHAGGFHLVHHASGFHNGAHYDPRSTTHHAPAAGFPQAAPVRSHGVAGQVIVPGSYGGGLAPHGAYAPQGHARHFGPQGHGHAGQLLDSSTYGGGLATHGAYGPQGHAPHFGPQGHGHAGQLLDSSTYGGGLATHGAYGPQGHAPHFGPQGHGHAGQLLDSSTYGGGLATHGAYGPQGHAPHFGPQGHGHAGQLLDSSSYGGGLAPHGAYGPQGHAPQFLLSDVDLPMPPLSLIADAVVQSIWRDNSAEAFQRIKEMLKQRRRHLHIAIDLEYLASGSTDVKLRPVSAMEWYGHLQDFVNNGQVVQLGMAFAVQPLPGEPSVPVAAYEINFQIDLEHGDFNSSGVAFLKQQGHNLSMHQDLGIIPEIVYAGLLCHLPFGQSNVTWIAYHGDRDIAFMLRLLQYGGSGIQLPSSQGTFGYQMKQQFPTYFDVRVLAQLIKPGWNGKLTTLATEEHLSVDRIGGEHFAGSDALLTLSCFAKLLRVAKQEGIVARTGLLSGAEELQLCIRCSRHISASDIVLMEIHNENFDQQSNLISELIACNFDMLGIQVIVPGHRGHVNQQYHSIKSDIEGVTKFDLQICFMNSEGLLGFGRVWLFHLDIEPGETSVRPQKLAALLASSRVTHLDTTAFMTYRGAYGMAVLLQSFIHPGQLPVKLDSYVGTLSAWFPALYDISVLAGVCPGVALSGDETDVAEVAECLGIDAGDCEVVTSMRCYLAMKDKIGSALRGLRCQVD